MSVRSSISARILDRAKISEKCGNICDRHLSSKLVKDTDEYNPLGVIYKFPHHPGLAKSATGVKKNAATTDPHYT